MARCTDLIRLMEQQGHSISSLAKAAGVSRSTVIRYREGRQRRPSSREVRLLAMTLRVDHDWLYETVLRAAHGVAPTKPQPKLAMIAAAKAQLAHLQRLLEELEGQVSGRFS